ncbi:hypothetical protein NGRA_0456 [Nosema granulosis]|uniref:Rho-GAP domain-containing protein n=1 Tax=Nosema granulosis TaxID=83296 RepID=A0A9P6H1Y8_9MICR|nr:hypothetical protein NGRA_0456 [Nosema granulosis]
MSEKGIIHYENLNMGEMELLRKECLKVVRMETKDKWYDDIIDYLYSIFECCSAVWDKSPGMSKDVIKVVEILIKNGNKNKLFYREISKEKVEVIFTAMSSGLGITYEKVDPYVLAAALKMYCKVHLNYHLPKDVQLLLLYAYKDNVQERMKEIISRVPFIMSENHRSFFLKIFKLFRGVDEISETSKTNLDDMLNLFSPLLIKDPSCADSFNVHIKKKILKDLMKVDFFVVPKEFISTLNYFNYFLLISITCYLEYFCGVQPF